MEAIVLDIVTPVLCRVHIHMLLSSVQHVSHPYALQVADVTDGVTIA